MDSTTGQSVARGTIRGGVAYTYTPSWDATRAAAHSAASDASVRAYLRAIQLGSSSREAILAGTRAGAKLLEKYDFRTNLTAT